LPRENCPALRYVITTQSLYTVLDLLLGQGVTRLDGARGKKQV